jgi:hypothetical protein
MFQQIQCRAMGVVVDSRASPPPARLWIDDGTRALPVVLPAFLSTVGSLPRLGALVDVIGHMQHSAEGTYIECYSFQIKEDSFAEITRTLEILHLYVAAPTPCSCSRSFSVLQTCFMHIMLRQ